MGNSQQLGPLDKILEDRVEQLGAIASAGASDTLRRPGSPWMPTPISISLSANVKFGRPAAGTVHGSSATPIERVRRLTSLPSTLRSASPIPVSAAAPTIFSTISVPPTPRRGGRPGWTRRLDRLAMLAALRFGCLLCCTLGLGGAWALADRAARREDPCHASLPWQQPDPGDALRNQRRRRIAGRLYALSHGDPKHHSACGGV